MSRKWQDTAYPALEQLRHELNAALDRIHDEAVRKFRALARAVGQRTRVDRL